MTLQSVTVERPAAAVAGRAGIGAGRTPDRRDSAQPSKNRIEPPPAATVWICIIGARMRTPATLVSKARSYSPS